MEGKDTFFDILDRHYKELPKKQMKLADYLRTNYKTAVFQSCVPMAKENGISEATVVRLANSLGYEGFTDMINHIRDYIKNEMTLLEKLEGCDAGMKHSDMFKNVVENNIKVLKTLPKLVTQDKLDRVVEDMSRCSKLYLIGYESAAGLVEYIGHHLIRAGCSVEIINEKYGSPLNLVNSGDENVFSISIAFPRYSKNQQRLMEMLSKKAVRTCLVTDSPKSPLMEFADYSIFFPLNSTYSLNADIYAAVFTFFQILLYEYCARNYDKTRESLSRLEDFNKVFQLF